MMKFLIISVTQCTPQNRVIDTIRYVTLNTINGVVQSCVVGSSSLPIFQLSVGLWSSCMQSIIRYMRLMWTPPTLWNHPTNGFEHQKLEQVSNCQARPKNLKSLKLELRKLLVQALQSKILYFPIWCYRGGGGTLPSFKIV